jgi:hypothetical protein
MSAINDRLLALAQHEINYDSALAAAQGTAVSRHYREVSSVAQRVPQRLLQRGRSRVSVSDAYDAISLDRFQQFRGCRV